MRYRRRYGVRGVLPVLVLVILLLAACGAFSDDSAERLESGTVVMGVDQEPSILNGWLGEGNLQATHTLELAMLYPLWRLTPDFEYEPLLLDGEPEVTEDPFTVTYRLKDAATWSDGVPITAEDIRFTLETCLNEDFAIAVRAGCEKVDMEASEVVDDKTFRMVFTEPYAPWKSLFSNGAGVILPAHELEGKDFNSVWDTEITVSSGPFRFESWNRGQSLTLVRNDNFWGERPDMERVVLRFIEDSTVQVQALRGGEIDILSSQAQLDLVEQVNKLEEVTPGVVSGGVWEFFELNHAVPGLDQPFVRRALAMGINRQELTSALIGQMQPDAEPLHSLVYVNDQAEYVPAFERWEYDPAGARALLEENDCSTGDDGIYVCDGTRLAFTYGYTAGNELRELQFVVIQYYLKEVGIELRPVAEDAATFFGDTWPAGDWELFNQAWLNTADPNPSLAFWECEGQLNYRSYCNEEVDQLIAASRTELDPQRRADLLNEANEIMAQDLPALPLYQKPTFLAWDSVVSGPQPNATDWGHMWNIEEWGVK